jgi:NAD(P)-dependent dehydrogenase (short-subunit alcohol dehydrogenase family)
MAERYPDRQFTVYEGNIGSAGDCRRVVADMVAAVPDRALDRIKEQIPLGRLARPEEVARAVCFLAADESAYITGQIWAINGGLDM